MDVDPREEHHSNTKYLDSMRSINVDIDQLLDRLPSPDSDMSLLPLPSLSIPYPTLEQFEKERLVPAEVQISASRNVLSTINRQTDVVQTEKQKTITRLEEVESRLRQWRIFVPVKGGPIEYPCREFESLCPANEVRD